MANQTDSTKKYIAVILVRGLVGVSREIGDTLHHLRLRKKHACAVFERSPQVLGMLQKAKDFVTWGYIDDDTYALLKEKRGRKDPKTGELYTYFLLQPPKGGFEKKGIKNTYGHGGVLGFRDEKINDLIKRMV